MRLRSQSNGMQCPPPGRVSASRPAPARAFHLSGDFKAHCNDMVSVAERISRLFSRKKTYHVHRNHKSMSLMSLQQDQPVYSINNNNNDFYTIDQEQVYEKSYLNSNFGSKLEVNHLSFRHGSEPFLNKLSPEKRKFPHIMSESNKRWSIDPGSRPFINKDMHLEKKEDINISPEPNRRWSVVPTLTIENSTISKNANNDLLASSELSERSEIPLEIEADKENSLILPSNVKRQGSNSSFDEVFIFSEEKERSCEKSPYVTPSLRKTALNNFSRGSSRCSVQLLDSPNESRWADAADRLMMPKSPGPQLNSNALSAPTKNDSITTFTSFSVVLVKSLEPLGIHVVQSTDEMTGQDRGLLIEEIEPNGRIAKDQRIQRNDIIVTVNNHSLLGISFERAKEIFSDAMQESELCLHILRNSSLVHSELENSGNEFTNFEAATSTPKKVPSFKTQPNIQQANTRKIGKKVNVSLIKGQHGLGFSITTRDNHHGGESLIYIKCILPKGSAIEDGTLRVGDRLLEINSVDVTGKNQAEIVRILREIPQAGIAALTLSRQGSTDENTNQDEMLNLPTNGSNIISDHLQGKPPEKSPEDSLTFPWKPRNILSFRIPLHSSEKNGLGIKVKGKTVNKANECKDLGIFVKSILEGGAASIDGQLQQNDQLININGMSLLEKSNNEAMKILYSAMNQNSDIEILLTISRRFDGCGNSSVNSSGITSSEMENCLPALTSTPIHSINEASQKSLEKVVNLENFENTEISSVSGNSTIVYDEQNYSDFEEIKLNDDGPGTSSFGSVCDTTINSNESKLSHTSNENCELGFSRDQLFRQSMSEKRPATLDGKNTDTLQRNKKAREEKERQRQLLLHENVLNDDSELQSLTPKQSSSVYEGDLTQMLCFESSSEHNKPFYLDSVEESVPKLNKKSVINGLGSIFNFNKSNQNEIEKQINLKVACKGTHNHDLYLNGQKETGILY